MATGTGWKMYMPKAYSLRVMKVAGPEYFSNKYTRKQYILERGDSKLEDIDGEYWNPKWETVVRKYRTAEGKVIDPDTLPEGVWVSIQRNPDLEDRLKNVVWAIDAAEFKNEPFELDGVRFDPKLDMTCCVDDGGRPTSKYGFWPVKKEVFEKMYMRIE